MFYNKRWIIDDEQFYIRTHCHRFGNAFFFSLLFFKMNLWNIKLAEWGELQYPVVFLFFFYCKWPFSHLYFQKISSIASLNFSIGRRSFPLSLRTVIVASFEKRHLQKCQKPITIFLCLRVVVVVVFKLLVASKVGLSNDPRQRRLERTNTPQGLI